MKQFLITRFNLKIEGWNFTKHGENINSEKWLENRFSLFENYCLPSVKNQSNLDFKWCIFFDKQTPTKFIQKIKDYELTFPNIVPLYVENSDELIDNFKKYYSDNYNEDFIITTRLDNDDLIHKDFINEIQNNYEPLHGLTIDLRKGYQVFKCKSRFKIRMFNTNFNPFISYVENTKLGFETVMHRKHLDFKKNKLLKFLDKKPLWIEFVHQGNKYNTERKEHLRVLNFKNSDFGLDKKNFNENLLSVHTHNFFLKFKNKCKKILRK
ncbi:putative rhamnosyl transferase [Psychroflexus sp. CAK57W]|uniref:glycosyltransferase n=1 Tax=Psychroflexus curvus TaxID=2873595 RepID=UPI001CCFA8E2|nr:glycosyltransferase [Psychroflexus curvus]MBZ9787848.1 putative rhamnosyl transferase [Psychroflexus curvus]